MATTTTVVTTTGMQNNQIKPWQYGLFSCCDNGCVDCLGKTYCLECQWGKAMELAFGDSCVLCCLLFYFCLPVAHILSCIKRGDVRGRYNLMGSGCNDCLSCWCCTWCHYIQVIHEIEFREQQIIDCCGGASGSGNRGPGGTTRAVITTISVPAPAPAPVVMVNNGMQQPVYQKQPMYQQPVAAVAPPVVAMAQPPVVAVAQPIVQQPIMAVAQPVTAVAQPMM